MVRGVRPRQLGVNQARKFWGIHYCFVLESILFCGNDVYDPIQCIIFRSVTINFRHLGKI